MHVFYNLLQLSCLGMCDAQRICLSGGPGRSGWTRSHTHCAASCATSSLRHAGMLPTTSSPAGGAASASGRPSCRYPGSQRSCGGTLCCTHCIAGMQHTFSSTNSLAPLRTLKDKQLELSMTRVLHGCADILQNGRSHSTSGVCLVTRCPCPIPERYRRQMPQVLVPA